MKHNATIFDLLSALSADIDENKCGTFVFEEAFLIYAMIIKQHNIILIKRSGILASPTIQEGDEVYKGYYTLSIIKNT